MENLDEHWGIIILDDSEEGLALSENYSIALDNGSIIIFKW